MATLRCTDKCPGPSSRVGPRCLILKQGHRQKRDCRVVVLGPGEKGSKLTPNSQGRNGQPSNFPTQHIGPTPAQHIGRASTTPPLLSR
ncbi:hypothetical protein FKM82_005312 [Ascaphus truei]